MMAERHIFLFTDLVGFTALTSEEGDDRAAEVALLLHEHVRRLAAAYGAEEIKTLGDAVMLRCDEAAPALELGLRIVDDLEQLPGFPPVRVGMHTGPAVERARDWFGATVNVAARLCAAAAGGQVLASQSTCDAAGHLPTVELSDPRLHWLKNVTEPVPARLASRRVPALAERHRRCFLKSLIPRRTEEVLS
jgi:adenylate cyclase